MTTKTPAEIASDIAGHWLPSLGREKLEAAIAAAIQVERDRARDIALRYGDSDWNADIHNEPMQVAIGIETAARDIAAAIRGDDDA